jgi:hypothetical protein
MLIFFVHADVTPVLQARLIGQTAIVLVRHCGSLTPVHLAFNALLPCKSAVRNLQVLAMR